MTEIESTQENAGASRRTLLKGAVGAGVGLAAWSAPKIGSIPAYALTSSGTFNGTCYFISFNSTNNGNGGQKWAPGTSTVPTANQGQSSTFSGGTGSGGLSTYTWTGVLPGGVDLVVTASGDARTTGTITLVSPPAGCGFTTSAPLSTARDTGNYTTNIPAGTCTPSGTPKATGTYIRPTDTQIVLSGVTGGSGQNVVLFNIVCI